MTFDKEPAQIIAYVTSAATAVLALLVAFGIELDETQQSAILGVVAVVAPIVAGLLIRGNVYAPDTHDRDVDAAYRAGKQIADRDAADAAMGRDAGATKGGR